MSTIIRRHYPAAKLPEDLREGIDPEREVTITIEEEKRTSRRVPSLEEIRAEAAKYPKRSAEEIDADIRRLRDEWD